VLTPGGLSDSSYSGAASLAGAGRAGCPRGVAGVCPVRERSQASSGGSASASASAWVPGCAIGGFRRSPGLWAPVAAVSPRPERTRGLSKADPILGARVPDDAPSFSYAVGARLCPIARVRVRYGWKSHTGGGFAGSRRGRACVFTTHGMTRRGSHHLWVSRLRSDRRP